MVFGRTDSLGFTFGIPYFYKHLRLNDLYILTEPKEGGGGYVSNDISSF